MLWRLFHRSQLHNYLHGDDTWAVVTGASDGIGKALADELLSRGFNVLIHGRTESKVVSVLQTLRSKHPDRKVESVIANFDNLNDVPLIPSAMEGKKVTIFINNAALTEADFHMFNAYPKDLMNSILNVGVVFLTRLMRETIPLLEKAGGEGKPVCMVNIGSGGGHQVIPWISVYGGSKAYLAHLTQILNFEARITHSPLKLIYAEVHSVNSGNNKTEPNLITPTADVMAKAIINVIGRDSAHIVPYIWHEISGFFVSLMPRSVIDNIMVSSMEKQIKVKEEFKASKASAAAPEPAPAVNGAGHS